MYSALLANGKMVTAKAYDEAIHGIQLLCIDKSCKAPLFFNKGSDQMVPHFKTSGRGTSVHKEGCGFAKKLTFKETVQKVGEYQKTVRQNSIPESLIRLNLNSIDPDHKPRSVNRKSKADTKPDEKEQINQALRGTKPTPQTIGSIRAIKNLFTTVEPDLLASVVVSVQGARLPISELIKSCQDAHDALWKDNLLNVPYFIHGYIEQVVRRDKVWYINFVTDEKSFFSLVIFKRHFNNFTYKDDELLGRQVLAYGMLKKNDFNQRKKTTEMVIKSDDYLDFLD